MCQINLSLWKVRSTFPGVKAKHEIQCHLRRTRMAADLTQQELAERVGVSRQTILSIEKGKYTPSVALALRLAAVFGVRVEDLFALEEGDRDE
jgi:putative transcriptional regulator